MNRLMKVITVISALLGTLLLISDWLLSLFFKSVLHLNSQVEGASVGIIGGADGPTAIFISDNKVENGKYVIVLILYIITAIGIKNWRKEKN